MSNTFKDIINLENLKSKINDLYDYCDSIEEYGHVGCHSVKPEVIKEKSEEIHGMLLEVGAKLDSYIDIMTEEFEC